MITIGEMQIGGILTTGLLALTLALQRPSRVARHSVYAHARWLIVTGLALSCAQFMLQYFLGFRQLGVTQAVFINLLFLMPSATSISMGMLYVQRQGQTKWYEWFLVWGFYFVAAAILIITALTDGVPLREESPSLRMAENIAALLFVAMATFCFVLHCHAYSRMRQAVEEYYDSERGHILRWMGALIVLVAMVGVQVPFVIFTQGWPLITFSTFSFIIIYFCGTSFHTYGNSIDAILVEEAQSSWASDEKEKPASSNTGLSESDRKHIQQAATRWVEAGGYRELNLTLTTVANEMNVKRYQLKAWLQESEYGKLSNWLNHLRTEEAVRLMREHPDWALDAIAEKCGFGSRQYFHKVFRELNGLTPAKYQQEQSSYAAER